MTSCTIIISHFESLEFLRACIRQVRKYAHPEIEQEIVIIDQSNIETSIEVGKEFLCEDDIYIIQTKPLYSGFGIDDFLRREKVETDYIVQLHVDAFPISDKWLYLPIKLIEENNLSFVGQLQFISRPTDTIYPPEPFFAMAQCFNVAKTETYKEMSLNAGFTRFHNRPQSGLEFKSNDWLSWAEADYKARGSDDDVVAFHWGDKYGTANKLGLAITGMVGLPEQGSSWGRVIDDLVFHFGSANESRGVINQMPELYQHYTKRINEEGFTDDLLQEIWMHVNPYKSDRTFWDGISKVASKANEDLNNRIEELKK
jgi:hypothetical protein